VEGGAPAAGSLCSVQQQGVAADRDGTAVGGVQALVVEGPRAPAVRADRKATGGCCVEPARSGEDLVDVLFDLQRRLPGLAAVRPSCPSVRQIARPSRMAHSRSASGATAVTCPGMPETRVGPRRPDSWISWIPSAVPTRMRAISPPSSHGLSSKMLYRYNLRMRWGKAAMGSSGNWPRLVLVCLGIAAVAAAWTPRAAPAAPVDCHPGSGPPCEQAFFQIDRGTGKVVAAVALPGGNREGTDFDGPDCQTGRPGQCVLAA